MEVGLKYLLRAFKNFYHRQFLDYLDPQNPGHNNVKAHWNQITKQQHVANFIIDFIGVKEFTVYELHLMVRFVIEKDKQRPILERDVEDVFKRPTATRVRSLFVHKFARILWTHPKFQAPKQRIKDNLERKYGSYHLQLFNVVEHAVNQ